MTTFNFVSITLILVYINMTSSKLCQNGDYHCSDRNGLEHLADDEKCCDATKKCDGYVDCPFGDDEHNCPEIYPNGWICPTDGTYIPKEWSCVDGIDTKLWDCPNQDDVDPNNCLQCDSSDDSDSDSADNRNWFQCKDNGRCIPKRYTCDGEYDCMDKSDESISLCGPLFVTVIGSPTINRGPTATINPSQTPSESPSVKPSAIPSSNPSITPTPRPSTTIPTPSSIDDITSKPTEYFPPIVYIRMYVSDIVNKVNNKKTDTGIRNSISEVLPITKDMILNIKMMALSDLLNDGDEIPISLIPETKWNKWKKKGKTRTITWRSWKSDRFGIRNYVSIVVDITIDSIYEYHALMDHLFGTELDIFNTQLSLEHELMDALSISNIQIQIDQVSTDPLKL